ncbi:MAG: HsdM family class I SAM-dependent methyltransferase [Candidatus Hodarchaeales archaeon]
MILKSLVKDFGIKSLHCNRFIGVLIDNFDNKTSSRRQDLFSRWKKIFSESCGYDFRQIKTSTIDLVKKFNLNEKGLDKLIFCLQTYFSLVLTLLTLEIVTLRTKKADEGYVKFLLQVERDIFAEIFKTMPSNSIFADIGLQNFFESDFFWWFTDEWSISLEEAICSILKTLDNYHLMFSSSHLNGSRDIFKGLYEDLIPRTVRHDLGEYYTPNWVAEYIINNIELHRDTRILDPACGFGIFLIHAINRIRRQYGSTMNESYLLKLISNQIVGFDLNPIAIIAAQANYLIAIADLTPFADKNFIIPIIMKDTILAETSLSPSQIEKFNYIVGNPPWISWENLPQSYRDATQHLWKQYNLFSIKKGAEARLGGGKKDLSMLFVYKCIDSFLKEGGQLIFLITQSVFQSVKTGEGFRKFYLKEKESFSVLKVDELIDLKPFRASAQPTIIYCKKGEKTNYPINYKRWKKREKIDYSDNSLSFETVKGSVNKHNFLAQPSSNRPGSPWIIYPASDKDFPRLIQKLTGNSPYLGKSGVCTWLNGVFWIRILENYPDGKILIENLGRIGKISVPIIQVKIEPDLVFPLIRGRDVGLWNIGSTDNYYLLVTNDPVTRKGISISKMEKDYPETYKYLNNFRDILVERSGYKKYFQSIDPFYSIYNVDQKLFAPFRLLWSEIGDFNCSITQQIVDPYLGKKIQIPNNKVMYIPFSSEKEAFFVAGVINSPLIRKYITAKKLSTSTSTNLIGEMRIPKFNIEIHEHQQIVKMACDLAKIKNDKKSLIQLQTLVSKIII